MTPQNASEKISFTLHLPADVAIRLKVAAEAQKRPAGDVVVELLERFLPRLPTGEQKKGNIPYS